MLVGCIDSGVSRNERLHHAKVAIYSCMHDCIHSVMLGIIHIRMKSDIRYHVVSVVLYRSC